MKNELDDIRNTLKSLFNRHVPPLQIRKDTSGVFETSGTKQVMQGKQVVDGHYYGSVVPKPRDIRLYFFPIYTHPDKFDLSPELRKCLKGKSCFHIRKLTPEVENEIATMLAQGVKLYQKEELI